MIRRGVVWAVALAVGAVLLAFAYHAYPTPNSDAPSFLVSAINFSLGRGLVNPFYPQIAFGDPTGANRHVYYPPLFPLVLSALMPAPTPRAAFVAVALLRVASLALAAVLLCRIAGSNADDRGPRDLTWPAVFALCGMATNWLPTLGRPEALGTLLVLLAALAVWRLRGWWLTAALGALLGATAATQPMGGVELGLVVLLYFAFTRRPASAVGHAAVVALLGGAVFLGLLAAGPHGARETLAGMARSYPHTPWSAPPGAEWWKPWLLLRRSTFYGPLLLASLFCGAHLLRLHRERLRAPALFAAGVLALGACFYLGSLTHKSLRHYNALMLSPLFFGLALAWLAHVQTTSPGRRVARAAVVACLAATTLGFLGHVVWFPWFLRHGRGLEHARAEWRRTPLPPGARVGMLGNLWALTEDYDRLRVTPVTDLADPRHRPQVLLLGQRHEHGGRAPVLPGFTIASDRFNPALDGGAHRYFVAEDYSFAVYLSGAPP